MIHFNDSRSERGSRTDRHEHVGHGFIGDRGFRAILAHYIRADQPQRLKQKEALSPEVQAGMTPAECELLGLDDNAE